MASTVYAIGDVHGRADLLSSLIDFVGKHAEDNGIEPRVFFLGDIVDRGPDSREAMEIVCDILKRWPESRLLLGNHDQLFLDAMTSQIYIDRWFEGYGCQSARKFDPVSASNFDPFARRGLRVALDSSELAGIAETRRARVA